MSSFYAAVRLGYYAVAILLRLCHDHHPIIQRALNSYAAPWRCLVVNWGAGTGTNAIVPGQPYAMSGTDIGITATRGTEQHAEGQGNPPSHNCKIKHEKPQCPCSLY
eukprot:334210-Rhodomonas_salina.1